MPWTTPMGLLAGAREHVAEPLAGAAGLLARLFDQRADIPDELLDDFAEQMLFGGKMYLRRSTKV